LTSGDVTCEAQVLNIGVGGLYVAVKGHASAEEGQTAILSLTSEVGVLEISGTVRSRREAGSERGAGNRIPVTGIAVQFIHRDEIESRILQSLIEGLRARSLMVRVAILLISTEPARTQAERPVEGSRGSSMLEERHPAPLQDRRQATRVRVDVAARVEFVPALPPQGSRLMNMSTGGACLRVLGSADLAGRPCTLTFGTAPSPETEIRGMPIEQRVRGEVVWVLPESNPQAGGRGWVRLGMRFTDEMVRGGAAALIRRYVTAREPAAFGGIVSEPLECRNERGQRLVLSYDHSAQPHAPGTPIALIAPGYGQTKTDGIPLAYSFVAHGFSAVRYDHSNHIGESDGGMVSTTLSGMKHDLGSVLQYVADRWPASPLAVVAPDLTGRAALRLFTCPMPVSLLVLLAPIIDVQAALLAAHHEDLIGAALQGHKRGISNVLGFNIDADDWLNDAVIERYADLQSSQDDAAAVQTATMIVLAHEDARTQRHAWTRVKESLGQHAVDSLLLPTGVRQLYEHAPSAPDVLAQLVARCRSRFFPADRPTEVALPSKDTIDREVRLELERLRMHQQKARANHIEFWRDYLDRSHYLVNFSDYWHLLDQIYRLLGPLPDGARVLDAGCGNGNFGMFLLIAQCLRQDQHEPAKALRYIGLDFVLSGLTQAKAHLLRVAAELRGKFSGIVRAHTAMAAGLTCADLNVRLPFPDNHFDRVVCTLVLGYLRDPLFTLRELLRVLAPHGKLVIANFKPHADLSQVYRHFATASRDARELEKVKQMLDASGQLAECAGQGGFRSFDRQELAILLMTAGASQPRLYSTFANQAYLAVGEKC
jgi:ubiquinone/menaquinone biosynthesis C-methylase UbiE